MVEQCSLVNRERVQLETKLRYQMNNPSLPFSRGDRRDLYALGIEVESENERFYDVLLPAGWKRLIYNEIVDTDGITRIRQYDNGQPWDRDADATIVNPEYGGKIEGSEPLSNEHILELFREFDRGLEEKGYNPLNLEGNFDGIVQSRVEREARSRNIDYNEMGRIERVWMGSASSKVQIRDEVSVLAGVALSSCNATYATCQREEAIWKIEDMRLRDPRVCVLAGLVFSTKPLEERLGKIREIKEIMDRVFGEKLHHNSHSLFY